MLKEQLGKITLVHGDCMDFMRSLPNGSVDLVVTDPPYELNQHGGGAGAFGRANRAYHKGIEHLQSGIPYEALSEMLRVCKRPNMYVFCSKDQLHGLLTFAIENGLRYDLLTWHKTNPVPTCNNKYLSDTEYILFMRKGANLYGSYKTKRKYFITSVNQEDKNKYGHPTIKPLEIIETLIANSSQEGDTVFDPFMGSGTTGVACDLLGRKFIGCEIEEEYFNIAEKRINTARQQLKIDL